MNYSEMVDRTREFYKSLDIDIINIKVAVASLTMTEYAKNYNDVNEEKIDNQDALATVGDSICGAYLMINEYKEFSTKKELTDKKEKVRNSSLNIIGKKLLENHLFATNNDLKEINTKDYATAFEALIGFVALNNPNDLKRILDRTLNN